MQIICSNCQAKFKIPDHKVPTDRVSSFACLKCKQRITIDPADMIDEANSFAGFDQAESDTYESPDVPFSFAEEEGKTALVCEPDPMARKQITAALDLLEYHQTAVDTTREALKKMRFHDYDLIVVNEEFDTNNPDTNGVLIYIERLEMSVRRNVFVVLLSRRFRTKDNMMTLNRSVNLIVNMSNIDEVGRIIQNGTTENEFFYRIYKESYRDAQHI